MQLVSCGNENVYLTGNPQITFFKTSYQRHTNFAYEWIQQHFESSVTLETTSIISTSVNIKRHGDLIRDIAVVIDIPNIYSTVNENFKWVKNLGHIFINKIEFIIGGHIISKIYGQWMNIWYELTTQGSKIPGFNQLTGNVPEVYNPVIYYGESTQTEYPSIQKRRLRIPIPFWFTQNPGLAYPLIATQYVESTIHIEFRPLNELFTMGIPAVSPTELFHNPSTGSNSNHVELVKKLKEKNYSSHNVFWKFMGSSEHSWKNNIYLDIKYVYLDLSERRIFAAAVSEYLITQVERLEFKGLQGVQDVKLSFFHPVKEMIWIFQRDDVDKRNQWSNYTTMYHDEDYLKFLELINYRNNAFNNGLTPNTLNNVYLPSGLTISEFLISLNSTDTSKLSLKNLDAFDQYLNIMYFGKFLFNAYDRQSDKSHVYYQAQEPYNTHMTTPISNKQIYMMSFAESPETLQPSGTANFSMFKESKFHFTLKERVPRKTDATDLELFNLFFYVRSCNVIRIMSGIASLVFAN
jgi:hypothetical protein